MKNKFLQSNKKKVQKRSEKLIAFFSHSSLLDGAEKALLEYIDVLSENSFLCHVFIPRSGLLKEELKRKSIPYSIVPLPWWVKQNSQNSQDVDNIIYSSLPSVIDKLAKINPDIIFTNSSVINIGALAALILNKPHIWSVHEFGSKEYGIEFQKTLQERCKFISTSSEKVIFSSITLKNYYVKYLPKNKTDVLYQSVDLPAGSSIKKDYFTNPNSLKLLILGSIFKGKRQEDALKALRLLKEERLPVELLIVGDSIPEYKKYLLKLVTKFDLQNVRILDFVNNPRSIIESCDVLVSCSPMESFGRVIVEAMKLGKPVIGTRSGGTLELVQDHKTGLLFRPKDSHDLAKKIQYFYKHKEKVKEFGNNARRFVKKKFTKRSFSLKMLEIINNADSKYLKEQSDIERCLREIILKQCELIDQEQKHTENLQDNLLHTKMELENIKMELESIKKSYWYRIINSKRWFISYPRKAFLSVLRAFKRK